ncbi:hypothetical protein [Staphylospora marina]|uniref:hypothetical protein n=1 Tax=Staphylospora marina TaxID=2490858 RepID=UPI000F5BB69C|nr:hypothetical protein [Staphylospora marina]
MAENLWKQMEDWEEELDQINWKQMLEEIDRALMDNLAAELGFPSFERLEEASLAVKDDFHVTHLSDGRWVWWSPTAYAKEDPLYFSDKPSIVRYISEMLGLDEGKRAHLERGLSQLPQMSRCDCCEHEFNPRDPERMHWDSRGEQRRFCSAQCAAEVLLGEMREDLSGWKE